MPRQAAAALLPVRHSRRVAMSAPALRAWTFSSAMRAGRAGAPGKPAKPQSVAASIRSGPVDAGDGDDGVGDGDGGLDAGGRGVDDAGGQGHPGGQLAGGEHPPVGAVLRAGPGQDQGAGVDAVQDVDDDGERQVAVMRAGIVAPADVQPDLLRVDAGQRPVEVLGVQPGADPELLDGHALVPGVVRQRQVRGVDLQASGPRR